MIFADKKEVSDLFVKQLEENEIKVFVVSDGSQYQINKNGAVIDKKNAGHYKKLLSDITKEYKFKIDNITHFWSLDIAETEELSYEKLVDAKNYGTHSALFLMHALEENRKEYMPKVWFVTNKSQLVSDLKGDINIAQSSLWGMGRVIGHQEHMDFYGGLIDIDETDLKKNVNLIFKEIINHEKEDQVAFRNGVRYVARLIEASDMENQVPILLNADSSYLITGGFGSLGTLFAKWMIKHGARRIILMGRKDLPKRSEWNSFDKNDEIGKRISIVRSLEAMGASIHVVAVDLTKKEELTRFVEDFSKEGWPEIKGIIHSAGVAIPKLMINMDALAHYRCGKGLPATSINWEPWAEVGMATQLDTLSYFSKRGIYPIIPEQGRNTK